MRSSFGPEPSFFKSIAVVVVVSQKKSRIIIHIITHRLDRSFVLSHLRPASSFIVLSREFATGETTDETIFRARIDAHARAHAPAIGHVTVVAHCGAMRLVDGVSTDDPGRRRRRGDASMGVFSRSWGDTAWSMGGVCMDVDVVRVGCTYGP